ncbi:MAG TPA: hypothetical protein VKZ81_19775 [Pseudonocardia sp.]|nr:hypothetical protein [Pseudonocardia sp.]HLU57700.1 hypothetical protein [Pseudonocardia sp.]
MTAAVDAVEAASAIDGSAGWAVVVGAQSGRFASSRRRRSPGG